jgi:putative ABC transport system permease protein
MIASRRVVACLVRIYGAALVLCPQAVRARYGKEMRETFAERCRDAAPRGIAAAVGILAGELADLVVASISARRNAGPRPLVAPAVRPANGRAGSPEWLRCFGRSRVSSLFLDIRYAVRMLRRQPGFTAVAVLTLGLGIGASTAVFTVVNGVLLRPLPYRDPDRLVVLLYGRPGRATPWFSPLNYRDLVERSASFEDAAAFAPTTSNLTGDGEPERVDGASVGWNYFNVLGVTMREGRGFVAADGSGSGDVVVISEGIWQRRYGGRAGVVGSTIRLDGRARTIVGVAPAALRLPADAEFWKPLIFTPRDVSPNARGAQWLSVVARLKASGDAAGATAALQTVAAQLAVEYERTNGGTTALAVPLHQRMVRNIRQTLLLLLGAVGFVLLIACVNVANLLLARAQARTREVSMRAALGAGRSRLIGQFLAESILLGVLGAAAGLAVAFACTRALVALGPASIPRLSELTIDLRVLAFAVACAVATSVAFGLAPALTASAGGLASVVAAARGAAGHRGSRTRRGLVVSEMALAVVLLVGAGLLIRSYERLQQVNPGFDPEGVVTFNLSLPEAKYPGATSLIGFTSTLLSEVQAKPGVESAAAVFGLPFAGDFSASTSFRDPLTPDTNDDRLAGMRIVTPDYFKTMKIPLAAGRLFDGRDDGRAPEVVLINQQTARRFFAGVNPIGQQIRVGVNLARDARSNNKTIVGIVGDVKYGRLDSDTPPEIYLPYAQHAVDEFTIAVRVAGHPMAFAPTLRREVAAIDRDLPIAKIEPMTAVIGASIAERRFTMLLLTAFAAVAAALAAIGIYGVLAYLVSQRVQEIGVRLAIGATPRSVAGLFVREGAVLTLAGLACGVAGALAITRTLSTLLFGVTTTDPWTFSAVAGALAVVALLASYLPARRAARVDPMVALRND